MIQSEVNMLKETLAKYEEENKSLRGLEGLKTKVEEVEGENNALQKQIESLE